MGMLKTKIVVVPMGETDFTLVNRLAVELGPVFGKSVDILKGMKMPDEALNLIRNQYYAVVLLAKLERLRSHSREKVLAVCEEDLYLPDESYVVSFADGLAGIAAVSLYRLRQEFYGLPEDDAKIYPRLRKEAMHQLAHLFDLSQCRNPRCANFYGQGMLDIDNKEERFCDNCQRQLTGVV
jgi:archaemetzincin